MKKQSRLKISMLMLAVAFIMAGMALQNIFEFAPLAGWILGGICLSLIGFPSVKSMGALAVGVVAYILIKFLIL